MANESSSLAKDVDDAFGSLLAAKPKYQQEEEAGAEKEIQKPLPKADSATSFFSQGLDNVIKMPAGYEQQAPAYEELGPEAKKIQLSMDSEVAGKDPKKLREMPGKGEPLSDTQLRDVFEGERNAPLGEKLSDAASGFGKAAKSLLWDDLAVGGYKTVKALAGVPIAAASADYQNNPTDTDEEARAKYQAAQAEHAKKVDAAKDEAYKAARSFTSGVVSGVEGLVNTGVKGSMYGSGLTDRIRELPGGNIIVGGMTGGSAGAFAEAVKSGLTDNRPSGAPTGTFKGRAEIGNIDLDSRPMVKNEDGTVSTVRSMSFNDGKHEVLIPAVSPDGKILSDEDAIKLYRQTGQHLGKFDTVADADNYAEALHKAQDARYSASKYSLPQQTEQESFENWRNREQLSRMEAEDVQQNPDRAAAMMAENVRMNPLWKVAGNLQGFDGDKFREDMAQNILDNQIKPDPNIAGFGAAVSPINPVVFAAGPLAKLTSGVVDKAAEGVLRAGLKTTVAGMHPVEALGVGLQKIASGTQAGAKRLSDFLTGSEDSAVAKAFDPIVVATKRPGMILEGTGRIARDLGRQIDEGGFRGRTGIFQRAGQDSESGSFVKTVFGQGAEKERPSGPGLTADEVEGVSKPIRIGPTTAKAADYLTSRLYGMNKHGLSGATIALAMGVPDIENAEQFGAAAGSGYALGSALSTRPLGKVVDVLNPKTSFKEKVDSVLGKNAEDLRADQDADIARFRASAGPEVSAQVDSFGSKDTHVQAWDGHIATLERAKAELVAGGADTKDADAKIAGAKAIRDQLAKASPEQFKEVQRQMNLAAADAFGMAKTTGEAVGLNGLNVHILDSAAIPEFLISRWGKTLSDAQAIVDQLGDKTDLSQSEKESLLRARETVANVQDQLTNWPDQRGFALSPSRYEDNTPAHLRMGNLQTPEVVINADLVRSQLGTNFSHALGHEIFHGLNQFKEVKGLIQPLRDQLFGKRLVNPDGTVQEISSGMITDAQLDKMAEVYAMKMGGGDSSAASAWKAGFKNQEQLRDYMREEYLAELSGLSHNKTGGLREALDSPGQAITDWLAVQNDNSALGKLRDMLGMKGVVLDGQGRISTILGAELDPQALAMMRQFQRKLGDLNKSMSLDSQKAADVNISLAEAMTNRAVQEKTKDQDLWAKENVYQVKDKNGNVIAEIPISNENESNPLVGEYRIENGYLVDEKGQMLALTPELRNAGLPADARISVDSRIVRNPDGTPKILTNKEIRSRARERSRMIREALDNAPQDGFEGRLEDIGNGVYRGTMSPSQIAAILALPNSVVAPGLKRKIVQFNDVLQRKDGSRVIVEYQAALRGGGYKALSPRTRDLVPIGFHFSKDGNFLAVNMSVSRMFDKLNAWVAQKPENLNLWGRDTTKFWDDVTKVLANHAAGQHAEVGLDVDPSVALQKKNRINDFFNIFVKDTKGLNPDRTVLKTRKGQDSADRIIMSTRMDRINAMELSNAEKLPVDYEKMKVNFMPAESDGRFVDDPTAEPEPKKLDESEPRFMPSEGRDEHEAFLDHIEDNYRDGYVPVAHSLSKANWEEAVKKGYLGADTEGIFATLGDHSEFYSGKDRVHVRMHLPIEDYAHGMTPDMRYDNLGHFIEEHPNADGGDVYIGEPIPFKHIVGIDGDGVEHFGTKDPFVYHITDASPKAFARDGIRPSEDGYSGPGVYMANTPEATQYYHDLDEGQLLRIRKHALVDRFGKYPENKDGVQYDDGTGEVILSNGQNVPPDLIEFKDSSGNWRSVSDAARFMPKETEGKDLQQSDLSGWEPGSLGGVKPPNPMQPSDSPQEKPLTRVGGPGKAFTERWDNAVTVDNSDASPQDQRLFMVTVVKPNGDPLEESFFVKALTRESARAGLKNTRSRIASVYRGKAEAMISEVEPDAGEPVDWGALRAAINQG